MRRERKLWLVVTFYTTAAAMAMESNCSKWGINGRLIPVPREITSDCGIGWRMDIADRPMLEENIKEKDLQISGMYEVLL